MTFHIFVNFQIVLFSYGKVRISIFNKDQISSGEGKRKGVRGSMGGESLNEGHFCQFPLLSKIQTLSYKHLVRQTSHHHHCNRHAQKPKCRHFQVILNSSTWSKTFFVYFERTNMASKLSALKNC